MACYYQIGNACSLTLNAANAAKFSNENLAMKNERVCDVLPKLKLCVFSFSSTASNSPRSTPGSSPSLRRRVLGGGRASEGEGGGEKSTGGGGGGGADSPLPSASSLTSAYPLASRHFSRNAKVNTEYSSMKEISVEGYKMKELFSVQSYHGTSSKTCFGFATSSYSM